ncbi:MAG: ABC transporter permease [Alphaproteobacteria bacterium]
MSGNTTLRPTEKLPAVGGNSAVDTVLNWTRNAPLLVTVLAYLFLFVPIVVLIVFSFNETKSTVVWSGFSLDWYTEVFNDRRLGRGLWISAVVSVSSAFFSTAIGALAALAISKRQFPGRDILSTVMVSPLILPEIVFAVGLLVFMVTMNLTLGYTSLIIGHILVSIPFTTLIVRSAASALDGDLEEAGADLGASEIQVFFRITLPILMPAIAVAFLLAATISFDNFVMSTFTSGVGTTPLPLQIYSMLKLGITPKINALGTLMVAANIAVILFVMGRYLRFLRGG